MSFNIQLDVSQITSRLEKVEAWQLKTYNLLEQIVRDKKSTADHPAAPHRKHFVIKLHSHVAEGKAAVTIDDIKSLVIAPYIKNINPEAMNATIKDLENVSAFYFKYYILKRIEHERLLKTDLWSDIPQEIKDDAVKRLESFVRENLLLPLDKCEKSWAADSLFAWHWLQFKNIQKMPRQTESQPTAT